MTCKLFRHTIAMFLTFLVLGSLMCCIDDHYDANCDQDINDDFSIAFDISLSSGPGGAMRDISQDHTSEEIGDEVDYQVDVEGANNDFRILFFDKDDNFLFEPLRTYYQYELTDETYKEQKRWRVIIPASALKRQVDDNTTILDKIKEENFKIAVLANWPRSEKDKLEFSQGNKLYKLSHYWQDDVYGDNSDVRRKEGFRFLTNNGMMGAFTEWVKSTYKNQEAARTAICEEEREDPHTIMRKVPTIRKEGTYPHTYKHIWRAWHFGDFGEEVNGLSKNSNIREYWKKQFKKDQETFFSDLQSNINITKFDDYGGSTYHAEGQTDDCGLSLEGGEGCSYNGEGLMIGEGKFETKENNVTYLTGNRLMFNAFAAGKIRICAKKNDTNTLLYIQLKDNNTTNNKDNRKPIEDKHIVKTLDNDFIIYEYSNNINVTGAGSSDSDAKLTIPEVISIYAEGGSMTIKQIEFIEDKHLSDTDREGFLPGENNNQLIPMYGIQEFGAIGDRMVPGEMFNLSEQKDNYQYGKVHLLRSLAKVELLIPTGFLQLTHAYLRCVNRTSRCEPVDVSTSTYKLWNNVDNEITNIKNYGPFYKKNDKDHGLYRSQLSWFYKAWTEWNPQWDFNKITEYPVTVSNKSDYPHIFNTRINRSDYVHFIYKGKKDNYDYYVLYVPEKNIDDPSDVGEMGATPKIPHIELRFKDVNNEENLDDNDCYRIYFTDQNNSDKLPSISNKYDGAEQTVLENYGKNGYPELYPIMRNHIYRFTLSGSGQAVSCTVSAWDEKSTKIEFK